MTVGMVLGLTAAGSSAFAQPVEVVGEPGGDHCGNVVEEAAHDVGGGCEVSIASVFGIATFIHGGISEMQTTGCENELAATFNENGTGYIDTDEETVHEFEPGCAIEVCEESEAEAAPHAELEWPISGVLEYGGEQEEMVFTLCIRPHLAPEGMIATCTIIVTVDQNHSTHVVTFTADDPCHENINNEVSGTWQTVGANEIELIHSHYPGDYPAG